MKEIGGFIELDKYRGNEYYQEAIELNCGRNALAYLIQKKNIQKILLPYWLCAVVRKICEQYGVEIEYYRVGRDFKPIIDFSYGDNDFLYVVNYYGQLDNEYLEQLAEVFPRIIIDNTHAFFQEPLKDKDTIITCRKYFGIADGAYLFSDIEPEEDMQSDYSYDRMHYLLGRFEKTGSEFYSEYVENDRVFDTSCVKSMSALTRNLLKAIDYKYVAEQRYKNMCVLHETLKEKNKLEISPQYGGFMYPLWIENGSKVRKKLIQRKIYIPVLWRDTLEICSGGFEEEFVENLLPLPIDQRYNETDMEYMLQVLWESIEESEG